MRRDSKIKMGSNQSFGLVFFAVFLIIAMWPLLKGGGIINFALYISIIFLLLGLLKSNLLTPLNKLWFKFGLLLGSFISPIVMGIVFFLVVSPTGFIMRIFRKDLMRKKNNKEIKSYWINRPKQKSSMKQQF